METTERCTNEVTDDLNVDPPPNMDQEEYETETNAIMMNWR